VDTAADRGPQPLPRDAFRAAPEPAAGPGATVSAAGTTAREEPSMREPVERVYSTLKRMASNYATLAVLDLRRAAVQFAWLVGGGIFIAVLVVTAWLAGVVALAVWLLGTGLSWPAVLLIAAALNLAGAAIVVFRLRSVFDRMPFEATLRQLKSEEEKRRDE
jgi:uncharacterized membrane protein YqjE